MKFLIALFCLILTATLHGHSNSCGGNGGTIFGYTGGFSPKFYESPPMYHDYKFGGFVFKVPRRDWNVGVYLNPKQLLADFTSKTMEITAIKVSGKFPTTEEAAASCAPKSLAVLKSYRIRARGGITGIKTLYGNPAQRFRPLEICYVYPAKNGGYVCFRAIPIGRYADWMLVTKLMNGDLRYAKSP